VDSHGEGLPSGFCEPFRAWCHSNQHLEEYFPQIFQQKQYLHNAQLPKTLNHQSTFLSLKNLYQSFCEKEVQLPS